MVPHPQRGMRVRVAKLTDKCGDSTRVGTNGKIVSLQIGSAGVGDSPGDPYIVVQFEKDGHRDGFWKEELIAL